MLKSCMLVLLLCGCSPADPYMALFSQEQSARNSQPGTSALWSSALALSRRSKTH